MVVVMALGAGGGLAVVVSVVVVLRVDGVSEGTSAAEAGIVTGDVLLTWTGEEIDGGQKLMEFIAKGNPGDKVKISLQRGDEEKVIEVTLKARVQDE